MRNDEDKLEITLTGHIEIADELCEDGSEALCIVTAEGDEYLIKNKKTIRRLMKYAYYDSVDINFRGIARHSDDGTNLFNVLSFEAPKIQDDNKGLGVPYEQTDAFPASKKPLHEKEEEDSLNEDDAALDEVFALDELDEDAEPTQDELDELEDDFLESDEEDKDEDDR